jgi:CHAT domain-containing protein
MYILTEITMKRLSCLAVVLAILIVGCGTALVRLLGEEPSLHVQGQFGELARHMENKVGDLETASNLDIYYLCLAYSKIKYYSKLFPCLEQMDKRIDRGENIIMMLGQAQFNLTPLPPLYRAEAFIDFGDYPKAIVEAKEAYQYLTNLDPSSRAHDHLQTEIQALSVLGLAYALNGDRVRAMKFASELETMPSEFNLAFSTAKVHTALEDYKLALETIKQSKKTEAFGMFMAQLVLGDRVFTLIEMPNNFMISKLMLETGDVTTAKKGFDKLLKMPQIAENGEIYWMILFDRGRIAEMEGNYNQAIGLYRRAIEIIEEQRSTINTEVSKIGFVGDKQEVYKRLVTLLFSQTRYSEAFEYVERAKARALVDMLASRKQFIRTDASVQETSNLIAKLDSVESEAKMQDETITTDQSSKQRAVVVKLKEEIRNADPELASLVTVTSPEVAEIQQLLPSDETLIEYFGSGDTLFAFIVNREEIQGAKLEVKGLNQEIERFRKHIMVPGSYQFKANGQALYEKLIQPIEEMIGSKITIVPHGALHYLPFNALYSDNGFMIDRYSIRVLPSASVMKFLKDRREGHAGNLLAFGNPDLGDPNYDLPGAQNETIAITKDKPKSKLLLRKQATETALKQYGAGFRYIHFATHGTFDAEKPLSSGLLMAGDSENDGTLTVGELYDLRLPADLVTLSACETALGKVANGDDVVGFTRGFLYAGTSSIVSSLWKVDDKATSILMQQFYKSLKESDKRSALRTAQLKVKDTYNSHPYYWAAFQITGSVQ